MSSICPRIQGQTSRRRSLNIRIPTLPSGSSATHLETTGKLYASPSFFLRLLHLRNAFDVSMACGLQIPTSKVSLK